MDNSELQEILQAHARWLDTNGRKGKRADLKWTNLNWAFLRGVDLRHANLHGADLRGADLGGADLRGADLGGADLRCAHLERGRLEGAHLEKAHLERAHLERADLRGADLDYSSWPLWCGSLETKIDKRIACQLLYHTVRAMQSVDDEECRAVCNDPKVVALANQFHRAEQCGKINNEETLK